MRFRKFLLILVYSLVSDAESLDESELQKISDYASSLRAGIRSVVHPDVWKGALGVVRRVDFDDGVQWAAKICPSGCIVNMRLAINSVNAIERCCPNIPTPRFHGDIGYLANKSRTYYLMDWIEGKALSEDMVYKQVTRPGSDGKSTSIQVATIPEKNIITQLAEFVYNLTTCPIPEIESMSFCCVSDSE
jgi:hypothetical protein